MDACDLLDAIHYVMEMDSRPLEEDYQKAKDRIRYIIYHDMYERERFSDSTVDMPHSAAPPDPSHPATTKLVSKPYIPPTAVQEGSNPFGGVLDAPLG